MIQKLEALLRELATGKAKVKEEFRFSEPDSLEDSEEFTDNLLLVFEDDSSISCDITWSYQRSKGRKGDHLQPDDPDTLTLTYLDVDNCSYETGDDSLELGSMDDYPELRSLLFKYVANQLEGSAIDDISRSVYNKIKNISKPSTQSHNFVTEARVLGFSEFTNLIK